LHGGLMQLPLLPEQACQSSTSASISSELMLAAIKTAVAVCLAHDDNVLRTATQ
jgi:pyroglutamyl-peptidase